MLDEVPNIISSAHCFIKDISRFLQLFRLTLPVTDITLDIGYYWHYYNFVF